MAAIFGWLLSRLPARKKKIYIHASDSQKVKNRGIGLSGSDLEGHVVDRKTADHSVPDNQDS